MERPKGQKADVPLTSRLQAMRKERGEPAYWPEMPPTECCGYLIGWFFEAGPALPLGGGGHAVLTQSEILAWQQNTGIRLTAWEARTLRALSSAYVSELLEASNQKRAEPWGRAATGESLMQAAESMRDSMRAMRNT